MSRNHAPPVNYRALRKRMRRRFEHRHQQSTYWRDGMLYFVKSGLPVPEAPVIRKPNSGHAHAEHERKPQTTNKPMHVSQFDREGVGRQPRHWYDK